MNGMIYHKCFECCIEQMIKARAYEIHDYKQENHLPDDPVVNWLQAEGEIMLELKDKDIYIEDFNKICHLKGG